jgi:hypothetical protein
MRSKGARTAAASTPVPDLGPRTRRGQSREIRIEVAASPCPRLGSGLRCGATEQLQYPIPNTQYDAVLGSGGAGLRWGPGSGFMGWLCGLVFFGLRAPFFLAGRGFGGGFWLLGSPLAGLSDPASREGTRASGLQLLARHIAYHSPQLDTEH